MPSLSPPVSQPGSRAKSQGCLHSEKRGHSDCAPQSPTRYFTSENPLGFAAGDPNFYRYVGNHPTNASDPDGMQEKNPAKKDSQERVELAHASGLEFGLSGAAIDFQARNEVNNILRQELGEAEFRAFFTGYLRGQLERNPKEVQRRLDRAEQLEGQVQGMEAARERATWNPARWIGSKHSAMSKEEASARWLITQLRSPYYEIAEDGWPRLAAQARFAIHGKAGFPTNHALKSPGFADDPIVILASLGAAPLLQGTAGVRGAAGFSGGAKEVGKKVGLGVGIATGMNLADQSMRIIEGKQAGYSGGELAVAAVMGLVATPILMAAPGLAMSAVVLGLASAADAVGEGQPLTAVFRATVSLFGPKIAEKLVTAAAQKYQWTGPKIQSGAGQTALRDMKVVEQIKSDMLNGRYRFTADEGRIGGWRDPATGNYYIGEGHHRMNAALQIFEATGNASYVNKLLQNGDWTSGKPPASAIGPLPRR